MFCVNDTVFYGPQGVCKITEIKKITLCGKSEEYYILKPVYQSRSTFYIPLANQELTEKMHKVLSKDEIEELIDAMPQEDTLWIEDDAVRKEMYNKIIASGNRRKIAGIIKTLYLEQAKRQEEGKRLKQKDEQILARAEELLYHEFALVLDISPEQVVPLLQKKMDIEFTKEKDA